MAHHSVEKTLEITGAFIQEQAKILRQELRNAKKINQELFDHV
jgi:hypothetical protein